MRFQDCGVNERFGERRIIYKDSGYNSIFKILIEREILIFYFPSPSQDPYSIAVNDSVDIVTLSLRRYYIWQKAANKDLVTE